MDNPYIKKNFVTPSGLEPEMSEPKSEVLPITPQGNVEVPVRFELTNNGFAIHPLKPLGYRTVRVNDGIRTHDLLNHNQTF